MNLKGIYPAFKVLAVLSIFGIWKIIELLVWIVKNVSITIGGAG